MHRQEEKECVASVHQKPKVALVMIVKVGINSAQFSAGHIKNLSAISTLPLVLLPAKDVWLAATAVAPKPLKALIAVKYHTKVEICQQLFSIPKRLF